MPAHRHLCHLHFCLCLLVIAILSGCASRKIVTSVEDQSYVPGPTSQAPTPGAEAKVSPPVLKEARIAEQPIAPAPPVQPSMPQAKPIPELADIFFDFDRFVIRDDARSGLEANAGVLKSQSGEKVLVEGHCDERGTSAYNLVLGEKRAKAVRNYLVELGISASRLSIVSYGKERPFCNEHAESCYQQNRRGHLVVKSRK